MNLTEDRLRAVLREAGGEISPDRVRPLDLRSQRTLKLAARDRTELWRRSRWLQALGAAVAVAAVAIAATAIATGTGGHSGGSTPSAEAHVRGVPPYYILIATSFAKNGNGGNLPLNSGASPTAAPPASTAPSAVSSITTIRDTSSGHVLATVHPPKGYSFAYAAPGSGDDSFLLLADNQHRDPAAIYLLRFNPAARDTTLTRLAIPVTRDTQVIAMSPAGAEVAVVSGTEGPQSAKTSSSLQIYTLSGRMVRQWQGAGVICADEGGDGMPCLSWAASGYLAFLWTNNGSDAAANGIRLVRTTAASGSLLRASRLVVRISVLDVGNLLLSGNGATIIAAVTLGHFSAFEEFSAATGKLTGRYWVTSGLVIGVVYWSNHTGSTLMVVAPYPRTSRNPRFPLGTLTRGRFTPLPSPAVWLALAF
jgi:hypothetical protein